MVKCIWADHRGGPIQKPRTHHINVFVDESDVVNITLLTCFDLQHFVHVATSGSLLLEKLFNQMAQWTLTYVQLPAQRETGEGEGCSQTKADGGGGQGNYDTAPVCVSSTCIIYYTRFVHICILMEALYILT